MKLILIFTFTLFSNLVLAAIEPPFGDASTGSRYEFYPPAASLCEVLLAPKVSRRIIKADVGEYKASLRAEGQGVWQYDKKLPLTSPDGVLRVGFWGTGSAFAKNQFQTNFIVIKGNTRVGVDFGNKTTMKMQEFGVGVNDFDDIIITHSHADHMGSIEEMALKARYERPFLKALAEGLNPQKDGATFFKRVIELRNDRSIKPRIYIPEFYRDILWSKSLEGGLAFGEETSDGRRLTFADYFNLINPRLVHKYARTSWTLKIGEGQNQIHFEFFVVPHIPDTAPLDQLDKSFYTIGMLIDGKVLMSGDTRYDPKLFLDLAGSLRTVDTIIHDSQSFPGGVHAWEKDLRKLPSHIKEKLFLVHTDDGLRPLKSDGTLGGEQVIQDGGFAGFAPALPSMFEWPAQEAVEVKVANGVVGEQSLK